MKMNNIALGVIVAAFGAAVMLHVRTFPEMAGMEYGPEFFPGLIGGAFVLIGVALVTSSLLAARTARGPLFERPAWTREPIAIARAAGVVGAVVVFALVSPLAGFLATTILITAGLLILMGVGWRAWIPIALIMPVTLYYVFSTTLRVPLPRGILESLFF